MADELKAALFATGHRVREYCPVGDLLPGMAYLVRRLLENTSNEGFLRAKDAGGASRDELLRNPVDLLAGRPAAAPAARAGFQERPQHGLYLAKNRERMRAALGRVAAGFGRKSPACDRGKEDLGPRDGRLDQPRAHLAGGGYWARATVADADAAVAAARSAWPGWAATPAAERADILDRAAGLIEARRFELSALEVFEAGKPWIEADADIWRPWTSAGTTRMRCGRSPGPVSPRHVPGERDIQLWTPRGVGVVIAPGISRWRSSAA